MATIKITFHRSKEFCQSEAIRLGESVPEKYEIGFNSKSLTQECRQAIIEIAGTGNYPLNIESIYYWRDGSLSFDYQSYGRECINVDSHSPSHEEISEAILDAIHSDAIMAIERKKSLESQIAELQAQLAELN